MNCSILNGFALFLVQKGASKSRIQKHLYWASARKVARGFEVDLLKETYTGWASASPYSNLQQWLLWSPQTTESLPRHSVVSRHLTMASPSASPPASPPSEGEIVESGSEKATTATASSKGISVDRPFRTRVSVSRSPSPIRSPRRHKSRTASRSPYREDRGTKRTVDDDHYDRARNDPRRFRVRYEDHPLSDRSRVSKPYLESNRPTGQNGNSRYEDRDISGRSHEKHSRRNLSPTRPRSQRLEQDQYLGRSRGAKDHWREQGGREYGESRSKLSTEQSVSDRGHSPVAAAKLRQEAEFRNNQTQHLDNPAEQYKESTAKYVLPSFRSHAADVGNMSSATLENAADVKEATQPATAQPIDEGALIEERRKRREAIKARHRGQATPTLVQALELSNNSALPTPKTDRVEDGQNSGELYWYFGDYMLILDFEYLHANLRR